jgi:hypothetical protein
MKKFTNQAWVLAALAIALMPHMMSAQAPVPPAGSMTLDDFTKGADSADTVKTVTSSDTKSYTEPAKDDDIVGGTRLMQVVVGGADNNPYSQTALAQVVTEPGSSMAPAFIGWFGYGALGRIYLQYGGSGTELNVDLVPYYALRVYFSGLYNPLNFNIAAYQGSNSEAGDCGINLAPYPGPFTVDFPLANFTLGGSTGVDFSDILELVMIFQGSPDLAITGFYAVPPGSPAATYTACPQS